MSLGGEGAPGQSFHSCSPQCPQPSASSRNEPCVVSCPTSRVIIYPPPVVVTFPGPIVSTCPQEAVLGGSEVLQGGGSAPETSLRAEILQPEPRAGRSIPRHGAGRSLPELSPPRARRCSYVFSSRWIHPCSRASSRGSQIQPCSSSCSQIQPCSSSCSQILPCSSQGAEEHVPEKDEPETGTLDAGNEDREALEEPPGEIL